MATRKTKTVAGPSVVKGTHLTVTTHVDGTTTLEWDDEQLLKEVREAIASVEQPKTVTAKKKAPAKKVAAKKTVSKTNKGTKVK